MTVVAALNIVESGVTIAMECGYRFISKSSERPKKMRCNIKIAIERALTMKGKREDNINSKATHEEKKIICVCMFISEIISCKIYAIRWIDIVN